MTRIQVLILTAVFFCGMFACSLAQQSTIETAQSTAENSAVLPSDFAKFVPQKASFLFVYRPKQLAENDVINKLAKNFVDSQLLPGNQNQVELFIVAAHHQTIERLFTYQTELAFGNIAAELAIPDESNPSQVKKTQKTKANYLNQNFSGLVRFESPSDWSLLQKWLNEEQPENKQYSVKKWMGRELLEPDCRNCCVVVRIDDRTFLVGNKEHFTLAFHQNNNPDSVVARWLTRLAKDKFRGEFYVGMDLTQAKQDWGDMAPQHGPWSMANQINEVELALDFTNSPLMTCKFLLKDATSAKAFGAILTSSYNEYRTSMNNAIADFGDDIYGQRKQIEQALQILKSLSINSHNQQVILQLQRPENFADIIGKYVAGVDQAARQHEAEFQAIADELNMAESFEPSARKVVVMRREIAAGEVFTREDVTYETWEIKRVPDMSFPVKRNVVGQTASQRLMIGEPVLTTHLKASSR